MSASTPIPRAPRVPGALGQRDVRNVAALILLTSLAYYAAQELLGRVVEPFDSSHLLVAARPAPGLRWDALHFLGIATRGYVYEQQLAFQPGWQGLLHVLGGDGDTILWRAAVLNTALRVAAAVVLYKLTHTLFDRRAALLAGVLYAFPPAPAVLAAPYTETSYALATFAGFYAMAKRHWVGAAAAFAAATSVRATGVFTTLPLAYVLVVPALGQYGLDIRRLVPRIALTGILCVIVVAPFIAFQVWTWAQFCSPTPTRPWCTRLLPSSYSFVQGEYWNVGLFKYWRPEQVPNFALAAPVLAVSLMGVYRHFAGGGLSGSPSSRGPSPPTGDVLTAVMGYTALMDALLIFASHTQIALRLAPTDPVVWWTLAASFRTSGGRKLNALEKGWGWWVCIWGAVSLVLWSGHCPPA